MVKMTDEKYPVKADLLLNPRMLLSYFPRNRKLVNFSISVKKNPTESVI